MSGSHHSDVIMGSMASQITSLPIVHSTVYSGAYQRKHQSSASLAFVPGIHRGPVNSPHKWLITRKMFPLMTSSWFCVQNDVSGFAILVTRAQPNWTLKPVNTAARVNTRVGLYCEGEFGGNQWTRSILNDLDETLQQQIYIVSRNSVSLP